MKAKSVLLAVLVVFSVVTVLPSVSAQDVGDAPVADAGSDVRVPVNSDGSIEWGYLDASDSYDPDGSIVSYEWEDMNSTVGGQIYDNGSVYGGGTSSPGHWQMELTVTDDDGNTDTDTATIEWYENSEPVIERAEMVSNDPHAGSRISLYAEASDADAGDVLSYEWEVDGSVLNGRQVYHTHDTAGDYTANLTVSDGAGGSSTQSVIYTVASESKYSSPTPTPEPLDTYDVTIAVYDDAGVPVSGANVTVADMQSPSPSGTTGDTGRVGLHVEANNAVTVVVEYGDTRKEVIHTFEAQGELLEIGEPSSSDPTPDGTITPEPTATATATATATPVPVDTPDPDFVIGGGDSGSFADWGILNWLGLAFGLTLSALFWLWLASRLVGWSDRSAREWMSLWADWRSIRKK